MTLGIFLAMGDSFGNMSESGQDVLFKKFYLSAFSKNFEKVIIFSYVNEKVLGLPHNVRVVPNKYGLHRYIYGFLIPFLNLTFVNKCDVMRTYHLFGTIPAILTKLFFNKNYAFNYAYDYQKFAMIENKPPQVLFFRVLEPIAVFFATKIFAANKMILSKLPSQKTVYLPNGVDVNSFRPQKVKKENKKPVVLSVGRLEKQKNFYNLILAMKEINAKLVIVGQGSLKGKLKNLAKTNRVNLTIIEKVPNTEMPKIYNKADIFVLPSLIEGSPKALLEAMACGLPVIGSQVFGIGDVINNGVNGFLCNTDPESILLLINRLLSNSKLRGKLSTNARDTVLCKYDLSKFLHKEIKVLKNTKN